MLNIVILITIVILYRCLSRVFMSPFTEGEGGISFLVRIPLQGWKILKISTCPTSPYVLVNSIFTLETVKISIRPSA